MLIDEEKMEVAYLIPSYNHQRFVIDVLESVLEDASKLDCPCEILIVDDGSSDGSVALIGNWVKNVSDKIRVEFIARENRGLSATLNQLVSMSSARYLRLCSSDDELILGGTNELYSNLLPRQGVKCVVGDSLVVDDELNVLHESGIRYHGGNLKLLQNEQTMSKELIRHWCVAGPTLLVDRDFFSEFLYAEESTIDDFDLFLSLLQKPDQLMFTDEKVAKYRIHDSNTSKSNDRSKRIRNLESFLNIIEKHLEIGKHPKELLHLKWLTKAKIDFLSKSYIGCTLKVSAAYLSLLGR